MINNQDNKFNYKIVLAALLALVIGILIAFYYNYAQANTKINFLEQQKDILVNDLTIMKADVDRLSALNEVNDIELQRSRDKVNELSDSIGRLNYTAGKLRKYRSQLRELEAKIESYKRNNNSLKYNNTLLTEKYENAEKQIEDLRSKSSSLAAVEALQRKKAKQLQNQLKVKKYLKLDDLATAGNGLRLRNRNGEEEPVLTNKASVVEVLRGCVVIEANPLLVNDEKVIYFQFLGPSGDLIEDNANTINVNGNVYSKRVEVVFDGNSQTPVCDFITVVEGSLPGGTYTLNVFEDERLLSSSEFVLK